MMKHMTLNVLNSLDNIKQGNLSETQHVTIQL